MRSPFIEKEKEGSNREGTRRTVKEPEETRRASINKEGEESDAGELGVQGGGEGRTLPLQLEQEPEDLGRPPRPAAARPGPRSPEVERLGPPVSLCHCVIVSFCHCVIVSYRCLNCSVHPGHPSVKRGETAQPTMVEARRASQRRAPSSATSRTSSLSSHRSKVA